MQQVDRAALEAVAQVTETNDAFKLALREGQGLDDLELALLPIRFRNVSIGYIEV